MDYFKLLYITIVWMFLSVLVYKLGFEIKVEKNISTNIFMMINLNISLKNSKHICSYNVKSMIKKFVVQIENESIVGRNVETVL